MAAAALGAAVLLWGVGTRPAAARGTDDVLADPPEQELQAEPGDADGDGIPDAVEIELGLDPLDADTDDDGIIDGDDPDPLDAADAPDAPDAPDNRGSGSNRGPGGGR